MAVYFLFAHDRCDRCGRMTPVRSMSFFTSETLCISCLAEEAQVMGDLREMGLDPAAYEDCGCIPTRECLESGACVPSALLASIRSATAPEGPISEEDLARAVRRLHPQKANARVTPAEPGTGHDLPPLV